jgi:hypothetical protein
MTDAPDGNKIGVDDRDAARTAPLFSLILRTRAGFNPSGDVLMGPVNGSSRTHICTVGLANLARAAWVTPISHGSTRVSLAFNCREHLIITEPSRNGAVGAPHASIASSYTIATAGSLEAVRAFEPIFQARACWFVIRKNGYFAYTTNNCSRGSSSISGYRIGVDASLVRTTAGNEASP